METNRIIKIVYMDNSITKVLRGYLVEEDVFTITARVMPSNELITIGKAALVKIERGASQC
jgi:hypothetical protein